METRARHVLIGAFSLGILVIAAVAMLWLGKMRLTTNWDHYDIVFAEAVTGLTVGGAVQYSGIQVGEVRRLSLDDDDPSRVTARIRVAEGTPIKADTEARLTVTGLTFVAVIQLAGGSPDAPPLREVSKHRPPRIIATRSAMDSLLASSEGIVELVLETLNRVSRVLDDRNIDNLGKTIAHVEAVTGEVARHDAEVGQAITDLAAASKDVAAASRSLRHLLARSEKVVGKMDNLADTSNELMDGEGRQLLVATTRVADRLATLIDKAGPTLTDLSERDLAQVGPALSEVRSAARALRDLAKTLEDDPQSVLRGKRRTLREEEAK